ncbi:MAG TPA: 2-oxoglutarate dehydrogenase E1 component [Rubrobacteraceae bacterium]|nr:2-oxoglutarate dehydrogenase E1 component [Rubrobacteraceae bacterium]
MANLSEREFFGPNLGYVLELYERYREDPGSVDESAREFFETWSPPRPGAGIAGTNGQVVPEVDVEKAVGASKHVRHIRDFGHRAAQLDPLGSEPPGDPTLNPEFYRISDEDLETLPELIIGGPIAERTSNAREAVEELRKLYCNTTGYDFGHVHDPDERFWLREAVESGRFAKRMEGEEAKRLLQRITRVDAFEKFLHKTFLGQKRFSVEGNDMVVPMLNRLIRSAADVGTPVVTLGMAHRGRLNVLAHVMDKSYSKIFGEFQQPDKGEQASAAGSPGGAWVGDVKYHLGIRGFHLDDAEADEEVLINLAPNPSHLEHVNPVVEGMARAAQEERSEAGPPRLDVEAALPIILHGDAAFPAEGVSAETLNLSRLPGYKTGGTIHIITNNQIGFTTERQDARSTTYASDLAKGFEIPVVHVNADDPEACLAVTRMAHAYREEFDKDFMIDLVGYRRFGHNEGDEPAYTQPLMYETIRNHPTVRELWAKELERRGVIEEGEADAMFEEIMADMAEVQKNPDEGLTEEDVFTDEPYTPLAEIPETAVPAERLAELNKALLERPEGFTPNSKLERLMRKSRGELNGSDSSAGIDWAHAETLAFASLLEDGTPIRITGQDTERGTFSQRHAVLYDAKTDERYVPLQNIPQAKSSFSIYNSPLSEIAVIGFEYGYSVSSEDTLVLWEAQYGDFANVGQPMIDQFIVSGQAKWGQTSGLVMLLPHGYEGQGPEHSSARLERYLQLAANENVRIANLTTAAQYFHILRAQAALKNQKRPLIIMAPKSLLRHPMAASKLEDLSEDSFHPVLDDAEARERAESVERLILCTGKIFTELAGSEYREEAVDTAIARIELLYPFPEERVRDLLDGYPNLREILWVQEEPKNMGAWSFVEPRLRDIADELPILYVGKPGRPSPAQGSAKFHKQEHAEIIRMAFESVNEDLDDEGSVDETQVRASAKSE